MFISLVGAIFITNLTDNYIGRPSKIDVCSNLNLDWQCQQVLNNDYSYYYRAWHKKWIFVPYVLRRNKYGDVTRISAIPLCNYAVSI